MTDQETPLLNKRIGIVGKGGSGKSTITVLLARALAARGYGVSVLDADSTNVGLDRALGMERQPATLIDFYGGMVFSGGAVSCPVDDPTPLPNAEVNLDELSGGFFVRNREGIILLTAGKIGDMGPGAGCDGPIAKIARDFELATDGTPLVALLDFKAGFEDSARGVITNLDWVIVAVDPTNAAVQMAAHMDDLVAKLRAGMPPATEHLESPELIELAKSLFGRARVTEVLVVLNRVRGEDDRSYLRKRLGEHDLEPIAVIPESPALMTAWLKGLPLPTGEVRRAAEEIVDALERKARQRSLGQDETVGASG